MKRNYTDQDIHTEDLQEIITKPPSWLLERGISFILMTVLLLFGLSVFIRYPEVINTTLKFNTVVAPKVIANRSDGTISKLLVKDETWVSVNTNLAYIESTADHRQVLDVLEGLRKFRADMSRIHSLEDIVAPGELNLGELQGSYQNFYLAYLNFRAVNKEGVFDQRKRILAAEISNINKQKSYIQESYSLQKQELALAEGELEKYRILATKSIISPMELQQKEAALLTKRQAIPQMENSIISSEGNMLSKNKELFEMNSQIIDEEKKFVQALNSFISEGDNWKKKYVLSAPVSGKLIYSSFLQENQLVKAGEELFYIDPNNQRYYGEMFIPQASSSKVRRGQEVLIKVHSYAYQEYGYIRGKISYISDIPVRDSVFFSKVELIRSEQDSVIKLKPGILGDADIITQDQSVFKRIWINITKSLKF